MLQTQQVQELATLGIDATSIWRAPLGTWVIRAVCMLLALGFACWLVDDVREYLAIPGWVETPAMIVRAELEKDSSSEDGTLRRATADYEYMYAGKTYHGNRVVVRSIDDEEWHRSAYEELLSHQRSHRPFHCYVDPANPKIAILYRETSLTTIVPVAGFELMLVLVGFGWLLPVRFYRPILVRMANAILRSR